MGAIVAMMSRRATFVWFAALFLNAASAARPKTIPKECLVQMECPVQMSCYPGALGSNDRSYNASRGEWGMFYEGDNPPPKMCGW